MEFIPTYSIPKDARVVRLLGEIGDTIRNGVLGVLKEIDAEKASGGRTDLVLLINSPGGSVQIGLELYEKLMEARKAESLSLTTYNIRKTESAAVCIYVAGETRACGHQSRFLLHATAQPPFANERWTASQIENEIIPRLRRDVEFLRGQDNRIAEIIALATRRPREHFAKLLESEARLRSDEAMREGLSQKIGYPEKIELDKYPCFGSPYEDMECL